VEFWLLYIPFIGNYTKLEAFSILIISAETQRSPRLSGELRFFSPQSRRENGSFRREINLENEENHSELVNLTAFKTLANKIDFETSFFYNFQVSIPIFKNLALCLTNMNIIKPK
jgi:hypothetical protein